MLSDAKKWLKMISSFIDNLEEYEKYLVLKR